MASARPEAEERTMNPAQMAAATAAGTGVLALVIKLLLGSASGLAVVYASGFHALAGLLYGLLTLGVLRGADQPKWEDMTAAEREHERYTRGFRINLHRSEAVAALLGSLVLLAVAYAVFQRVLTPATATASRIPLTLAGLAFVYFGTGFQARFVERIGRKYNVPMLVAASFHARTDALATLLAIGGVVLAGLNLPGERYLAGLIGLFLVADAAQLFVDAARRLVGLDETGPTAQMPFWERFFAAARGPLEEMPPIARWVLRLDDHLSPAEQRQCQKWAAGTAAVLYVFSGFRQVELGQVAAVKVFGRYSSLCGAGLVYAPWPFASVRIAPVNQLQRVTIGFSTAPSGAFHSEDRPVGELLWETTDEDSGGLITANPKESKYMLGDTTMVEAHVALVYRVDANLAWRYLFAAEKPQEMVSRITRQAVQESMVSRGLDAVLVENRSHLESEIAARVQSEIDPYNLGIRVEGVLIRSLHPPVEVLPAFVDVSSAIEDAERMKYEAQAYASKAVTEAEGDAASRINTGEADKSTPPGRRRGWHVRVPRHAGR